ncbi:hypothetical protein C0J52_20228, partial [Blattella germanica]
FVCYSKLSLSCFRFIQLLREKLTKAKEELDTLEHIQAAVGVVHKNLQNFQAEVPAFYVWGENIGTTEVLLQNIRCQLEESISEGKALSTKTKERYRTSQQLLPSDISEQVGAMEEKDRELKRARTVRGDFKRDVDEVQNWLQKAELKVQDRSIEPVQLKEYLAQIQSEIGSISDKLDCLTKNGNVICGQINDAEEKELIQSTIANLTENMSQVKSWLEEKKLQAADILDAWQRFLNMYKATMTWVEEKQTFLTEPLQLSNLTQARQKLHDYSNSLLQETSEEWEQCEKKMKDVRSWIDKSRQSLESPQNKKRPLREQITLREKMAADIINVQKTKISISVEKLQASSYFLPF